MYGSSWKVWSRMALRTSTARNASTAPPDLANISDNGRGCGKRVGSTVRVNEENKREDTNRS